RKEKSLGTLAISPDGKHFAVSSLEDLGLFDPETSHPDRTQTCKPYAVLGCTINEDRIKMSWTSIAFTSPWAQEPWLAAAETGAKEHGSVYLTRIPSVRAKAGETQAERTIRLADVHTRSMPPVGGQVYSLAFSLDGLLLAAGGNKKIVDLWSVKDGSMVRQFK